MWALILDGTVAEITDINPDGRFHASLEWIPCNSEVKAGDAYDGVHFSRPASPEPEVPSERTYSPLEFLDLFTEEEQIAATTKKQTDPHISLWFDRLIAAGFVRKSDPRVPTGLDRMVAAAVIAPERKAEILDAM